VRCGELIPSCIGRLLQNVWSFRCDSKKIFDLANQISQTEIGALGQISACVETITQKLGYVLTTDYLYSSPSQLKAAAELV